MREHTRQMGQEVPGPARLPVMRERADGGVVRAAMDLQHLAGNRSVSELVARSRETPLPNPLAALATTARTSAGAGTGGAAPAVSVQREPCIDCPDATPGPGSGGPATTTEPGEPG